MQDTPNEFGTPLELHQQSPPWLLSHGQIPPLTDPELNSQSYYPPALRFSFIKLEISWTPSLHFTSYHLFVLSQKHPFLQSWQPQQLAVFLLSRQSAHSLLMGLGLEEIITMLKEAIGEHDQASNAAVLMSIQVDRYPHFDAYVTMGKIQNFKNKLGNQCLGVLLR